MFKKYHEEMWAREEEKEFYTSRKIQTPELYIPIKFNGNLSKLLEHKKWWYIFSC